MSFHKDAKVDHEKQDVLQSASFNQVVSLQAPNVVTFPEGSTAGWLTVLGAALVLFSTFGISLSFGVLEDYYAVSCRGLDVNFVVPNSLHGRSGSSSIKTHRRKSAGLDQCSSCWTSVWGFQRVCLCM